MVNTRITNAINELMSASREAYGNDIVIDIQFNLVLGPQSRPDLSDKTIIDYIDDSETDGNK